MPAVVRVKRRIDEEPLCAFVLNSKKRRTDASNDGINAEIMGATSTVQNAGDDNREISTILKFAGTIKEQNDTATITQYARLTKNDAKDLVQKKSRQPNNHTERVRQEVRENAQDNRFRIVNCMRTTLDLTNGDNVADGHNINNELTIVDIEKQSNDDGNALPTTTAVTSSTASATSTSTSASAAAAISSQTNAGITYSDSDTGYVYDLYLPENEQSTENVDFMDDNYLRCYALVEEYDNLDDVYHDDSDSEKSDIDYPDEDEFYDVDDDDEESDDTKQMRLAMGRFDIDSSDDEVDEDFSDRYVTTISAKNSRFAEDVDRYGLAYAKYKRRLAKQNDLDYDDDNVEDGDKSDDVYNDVVYDSDDGAAVN